MKFNSIKIVLVLTCCLMAGPLMAAVYQEPDAFISEVFNGDVPKAKRLWIKKDLKKDIREIMNHDLGVLRIRYWQKEKRSAWILEEIGKEKPITVGIVVNDNEIEQLKVLIFRESRGWEVRHPFFTDQFKHIRLTEDRKLDKHIDAISGATLSRTALMKVSRLALFLHQYSQNKKK